MSKLNQDVTQESEDLQEPTQQTESQTQQQAGSEDKDKSLDLLLKEFDSVLKGVDLPAYDGEEGLENLAKALLLKKRSAYKEAEQNRIEKEQLEKQMSEKEQELQELQSLREQLRLKEEAEQAMQNRIAAAEAEKAQLRFEHAAEKYEANDKDYMHFKLVKHLEDIKGDQEKLNAFSVDSWFQSMKQENPSLFKQKQQQEQQRQMANTGLPPQSTDTQSTQTHQYGGLGNFSKTQAQADQTQAEFRAWAQQNGIKLQ